MKDKIIDLRARLYENYRNFKSTFKTVDEAFDRAYRIAVYKEIYNIAMMDEYIEELYQLFYDFNVEGLTHQFFQKENTSIDSTESIVDFLRNLKK